VRVEHAVHLLKTSDASVDEVAARVGYADGATLRTLLRRRLKMGVREIRNQAVTPSKSALAGRTGHS
jgi:transcriptional regulator GlxA family with amidase domain